MTLDDRLQENIPALVSSLMDKVKNQPDHRLTIEEVGSEWKFTIIAYKKKGEDSEE